MTLTKVTPGGTCIDRSAALISTGQALVESCYWQVHFVEFHWAGRCGTRIGGSVLLISMGEQKANVSDDYETYVVGSGMPASLNPFFLNWQLSQ